MADLNDKNNKQSNKPYFSGYAIKSQNKKTMTAFANEIEAEESGAVGCIYFTSVYVRDIDHTTGALVRLCERWHIKHKFLTKMKKYLLENCEYKEEGRYKYFKDKDLYDALVSTEDGEKMCKAKNVTSWEDVVVILNS